MANKLYVFFIIMLAVAFAPKEASADLWGDLSRGAYNAFHPDCHAVSPATAQLVSCPDPNRSMGALRTAIEDRYFTMGAQYQLRLQYCAISKMSQWRRPTSGAARAMVADLQDKLPLMRSLHQEIRRLRAELNRGSTRSLISRADGPPPQANIDMYNRIRQPLIDRLNEIEPIYGAMIQSSQLSSYPAGETLLARMIRDGEQPTETAIRTSFAQEVVNVGRDRERILSHQRGNRFELNRSTREWLFEQGNARQWLAPANREGREAETLYCNMDAAYGQGTRDLDNVIMVGSLALGGAGVLIKLSAGAKLAVAGVAAVQRGSLLPLAAEVLLAGGNILGTAATVREVQRSCPVGQPRRLLQNGCEDGSDQQITAATRQGNCALAIGLAALPSAVHGAFSTVAKNQIANVVSRLRPGTVRAAERAAAEAVERVSPAAAVAPRGSRVRAGASEVGGSSAPRTEVPTGPTRAELNASEAEVTARLNASANADAAPVPPVPRIDPVPLEAPAFPSTMIEVERRTLREALSPVRLRTRVRTQFIDQYVGARATTVDQNAAWITRAELLRPDGRTVFLDVENAAMKRLNDTLRDKNLVTSLTNLHKEILIRELRVLAARNRGLQVSPYSDFKSVRYAFSGTLPADLEAQLAATFRKVNNEFATELERLQVIRAEDNAGSWFRAGYGETADRANLAARASRDVPGPPEMLAYSSPAVRTRMAAQVTQTETLRSGLAANPRMATLLTGEANQRIPTQEVFDLIRKNSDSGKLTDAIRARYRLTGFTNADAESLLTYARQVDDFSPGIHVARRETVNLDAAEHGGFSVDFLGLGSANQAATAQALARSSTLDEALVNARLGERQVTETFSAKLNEFRASVGGIARCSGDDCVGVATRAMTRVDRQQMVDQLARNPQTREVRVGFIQEGIPVVSDRNMLSTHAESVEKFLRKNLEGRLPIERLRSMTFGIDMRTRALGQGNIDWLAGVNGAPLSTVERAAIQEALTRSVADLNADLARQNLRAAYAVGN